MASSELDAEVFDRLAVDGRLIERVRRPPLAARLELLPHPEGGWYRRTWTSGDTVTVEDPDGSLRIRPAATLILFLLPVGEVSAWHRVTSTEVWIWNGPGPVSLQHGGYGDEPVEGEVVVLGDSSHGLPAQEIIPAGEWQRTLVSTEDALVSCMVSPGFDFADFTMPGDA
ncbi:cupin domain-containing protein [Amnibacterium flavum]|uniref:Cupin n=1 Tax=Amnibacterium flavum TaxID=2173173 RepID=A0A2V1HUP9_9MICO|nr:cupin domain-containing protein [Amnibacterium flavum]PVZ93814.1 cupin [Amnibacterium flavum]